MAIATTVSIVNTTLYLSGDAEPLYSTTLISETATKKTSTKPTYPLSIP